jgi:hypothetical protein
MRLETYELPALGEYVHDPRTVPTHHRHGFSQASSKWRPLLGALAPVEEPSTASIAGIRGPRLGWPSAGFVGGGPSPFDILYRFLHAR